MLRPPPRSTLFPTRRSSDLTSVEISHANEAAIGIWISGPPDARTRARPLAAWERMVRASTSRSEEHTSELQSLAYLVCRLLLEKKKKKTTNRLSMDKHNRAQ